MAGYEFLDSPDDLADTPATRVIILMEGTENDTDFEAASLAELTKAAIAFLSRDEDGFFLLVSGPIAAGRRDVVLRGDASQRWNLVQGRVMDHQGRVVSGARVDLQLVTLRLGHAGYNAITRPLATTDEAGRFTLTDVWRHGNVVIRADSVDVNSFALATATVAKELVIRVGRRYRFRVEVGARQDHDAVQADMLSILVSRRRRKFLATVRDVRHPTESGDVGVSRLRAEAHGVYVFSRSAVISKRR